MKPSLAKITLRGFKTIRELRDFEPGRITVLIGPNGAGKSNLLSFFGMLSRVLTPPGELQLYVSEQGGASKLLHDGPAKTREIEAILEYQEDQDRNRVGYGFRFAADDTLAALTFDDEWFGPGHTLGRRGHREPELIARAEDRIGSADVVLNILRRMIVYHFDNTSATARVRTKWAMDDGWSLKEDGGNLAPFLYRLRQSEPHYYRRIVETLRLILPFFADFEFQSESGYLLLRWRERGSDQVFSVSQAADGMLRTMALVALLRQPERDLPGVLILDEPELGLHPYAIEVLVALIQSASQHCQVMVATQSVSVIDGFEPHDIVVVERTGRESTFRRLKPADLAEWRERYTMSELWEKNVLGGRP